jgi:hypothetical protein
MARELSSLDGFIKGDQVVLSDPITQEEFRASKILFEIKAVRTYASIEEDLKYTCYILRGTSEEEFFMLVVKEAGSFYELMLYYLDNEGSLDPEYTVSYARRALQMEDDLDDEDEEEGFEGLEPPPAPDYTSIIDIEHEDFADVILVANREEDGVQELQWNRKENSHIGMTYYDESSRSKASICEYFTDDDNYGNDLAFITCKGDFNTGFIEIWYGYTLQNHEVELFKNGTVIK